MYSKGIFGDYYQIDSLMHRINPTIKIISFFLSLLTLLLTNVLDINLMVLLFVIVLIMFTKIPLKNFFNAFYSMRYIYLLTILIGYLCNASITLLIVILIKIITLVLYISLISYTTSVSELSYGIETFLEPFNLFGLKLGNVSLFITSLIKFYPTLLKNINQALLSASSRGIDYNHSGLINRYSSLNKVLPYALSKTIKDMKTNKLECKIKLHNTRKRRTNINHNKISFYDIMLIIFNLLFILAYIFDAGLIK